MVLRQLKISLYHAVMLLMVIIASGYLVGAESAWKASEDAIRTMTPSQAKNLERFLGKIPKNLEKFFRLILPLVTFRVPLLSMKNKLMHMEKRFYIQKQLFLPKAILLTLRRNFHQ